MTHQMKIQKHRLYILWLTSSLYQPTREKLHMATLSCQLCEDVQSEPNETARVQLYEDVVRELYEAVRD